MSSPSTSHLMALKRILGYIKGTLDHGLLRPQLSTHTICAFFDPDCADFLYPCHSTTGYLIYFRNFPNKIISWCSQKQPKVFHSSVESEYRLLANACTNTTWISYLFYESCELVRFLLYSDNVSTTYMVANP